MVAAGTIDALQDIIADLRQYTHSCAIENELISEADEEWLSQNGIQSYTLHQAGNEELLTNAAIKIAGRTQAQDPKIQQSNLGIANVMGADRIVLNALNSAYRAAVTPAPEDRFRDLLQNGLKDAGSREQFIETLKAAKYDMIISIVQTMHPTIYHTKFAREREAELTAILEEMVEKLQGQTSPDQELLSRAKASIGKLIKEINEGNVLTPDKRVTVAEENELDHESHIAMKKNFEEVIDAYNRALETVAAEQEPKEWFDLEACKINLEDRNPFEWRTWAFGADADGRSKSTSPVLWHYICYQVPESGERTYISRKRDARENAAQHKDTVSALIQRSFILDKPGRKHEGKDVAPEYGGEFIKICEDFIAERNGETGEHKRTSWTGPDHSILQQLSLEEQAEFLKRFVVGDYDTRLSKKDFHFLPPVIKEETIAFNEMFFVKYAEFLSSRGIHKFRDLESLVIENNAPVLDDAGRALVDKDGQPRKILEELDAFIRQQNVTLPDGEVIQFTVDPTNLNYERAELKEHVRHSLLFKGAKTLDHHGKQHEVGIAERRKLLDVIKRAYILDHAIDEFGEKVSDRYQISEFGTPADFYAALLLFKEAGIITIKDGIVAKEPKPKLSIQPLLETAEDQANAEKTFGILLKDPLVRSYYKAIGKVEVMFGCSDGAKSAGNFSSEWSNYTNTRKLQKVFEDACKEYADLEEGSLKLRVLYGRGRGDSRGGHLAEGQNQRMMAPELERDMIYDVTLQSDLPMQMLISKSFGQDTCASILAGTIAAKFEAEQEMKRRQENPDYTSRITGLEDIISTIAEASKEGYRELVSNRPETMIFADTIHDNPLKSSRAPKREKGGEAQTLKQKMKVSSEDAAENLDKTRAITVEYAFQAMADFPIHYIGMRKALQDFITKGETLIDVDGRPHTGLDALQVLYETHPFFRNMLDKTAQGLNHYDPAVFMQYAKFAGVENWANDCTQELSGKPEQRTILRHRIKKPEQKGLRDLVQEIRGIEPAQEQEDPGSKIKAIIERGSNNPEEASYNTRELNLLEKPSMDLDKTVHAMAMSLTVENGRMKSIKKLGYNPFKPDRERNPVMARFVDLISFVAQAVHPENLLYPSASALKAVDGRSEAVGYSR